jgi:geranylgeranyl reductase family protein
MIVIVGAGPVGCNTAIKLAEKGISSTIIEEHKVPGLPFQCAGLVSNNFFEVIKIPEQLILNKINKAVFHFPEEVSVEFDGKAFVLDRVGLDKYLFEKAKEAGAKFLLDEKFESFAQRSGVIVSTNKRDVQADAIVGADGPSSLVGKQIGVSNNVIPAIQVRCKMECPHDTVELHFGQRFKEFFAWVIPEGEGICRVGLAGKENLPDRLRDFLKEKRVTKFIDKQGGLIPVDYHYDVVAYRALLVGDAASQTKATTGGGLTTGLICSEIAADALTKGLDEENLSKGFLDKHYNNVCYKKIGKELKKAYYIRKAFDMFTDKDFVEFGKVLRSTSFKNNLEKNVDMEMYSKFLKKAILHPKMFGFIIKFGIKHPTMFKDILSLL